MKMRVLKTALLFLCYFCFYIGNAQEMRSGLLLVNTQKANKTRFIPLNKKVKIWAGEDNLVYRAKILAVDSTLLYLSTGQCVPIKSVNSIRRKRIMLRDVGNAVVTTGVETELGLINAVFDPPRENHIDYNSFDNDDDLSLEDSLLLVAAGAVVAVVLAVGVGVITATVGVLVGIFEPRYYVDEWDLIPYNPAHDVFFVSD